MPTNPHPFVSQPLITTFFVSSLENAMLKVSPSPFPNPLGTARAPVMSSTTSSNATLIRVSVTFTRNAAQTRIPRWSSWVFSPIREVVQKRPWSDHKRPRVTTLCAIDRSDGNWLLFLSHSFLSLLYSYLSQSIPFMPPGQAKRKRVTPGAKIKGKGTSANRSFTYFMLFRLSFIIVNSCSIVTGPIIHAYVLN